MILVMILVNIYINYVALQLDYPLVPAVTNLPARHVAGPRAVTGRGAWRNDGEMKRL